VGNLGHLGSDLDRFSNCPELHRRFLEIQDSGQTAHIKQDGYTFHFSELNDGDYCFISFYISEKHPSSRNLKSKGMCQTPDLPNRAENRASPGAEQFQAVLLKGDTQIKNRAEITGAYRQDQTAKIPDPAAHTGLCTRIPEKLPGFPRGNS
jgi:hypothetical protein